MSVLPHDTNSEHKNAHQEDLENATAKLVQAIEHVFIVEKSDIS